MDITKLEIIKEMTTFIIRLAGVLFLLWLLTWFLVPILIILFSIFAIMTIYIARLSVKILLTLLLIGCLIHSCIPTKVPYVIDANRLANAIYLAEGGKKAQYPYGIRSIVCSSDKECRQICINTIRNNVKRYNSYGHTQYSTYLEFLASRYCPDDKVNWLKNVKYFLEKGVK